MADPKDFKFSVNLEGKTLNFNVDVVTLPDFESIQAPEIAFAEYENNMRKHLIEWTNLIKNSENQTEDEREAEYSAILRSNFEFLLIQQGASEEFRKQFMQAWDEKRIFIDFVDPTLSTQEEAIPLTIRFNYNYGGDDEDNKAG